MTLSFLKSRNSFVHDCVMARIRKCFYPEEYVAVYDIKCHDEFDSSMQDPNGSKMSDDRISIHDIRLGRVELGVKATLKAASEWLATAASQPPLSSLLFQSSLLLPLALFKACSQIFSPPAPSCRAKRGGGATKRQRRWQQFSPQPPERHSARSLQIATLAPLSTRRSDRGKRS